MARAATWVGSLPLCYVEVVLHLTQPCYDSSDELCGVLRVSDCHFHSFEWPPAWWGYAFTYKLHVVLVIQRLGSGWRDMQLELWHNDARPMQPHLLALC